VTTAPIQMNANKPRTPVRVNGAGPFDFLVDTGSIFDLVDTERAEELGIVSEGAFDAGGAGEATMTTSTATDVRLGVGDLELPPQNVEVAPINAAIGRLEGRRLDGLLGYDFFSRFPVELDYETGTLTVETEPRGTEVPLSLVRRHPFVRAAFELGGRRFEHEFVVDTGFRSGLVLASPFVREENLVDLAGRTIEATTGAGIGGPTIERVGRIARFELGPFVLEDVVVNLSQARAGTLADPGFGGIVGSEIIRRFRARFDYPASRLLLEPNAHFDEPFEFDLSGLYLIGGDGIEVFRVVEGSPAAEAGIREGDRIVTGQPLDELRKALRTEPGVEHTLEVERDGRRFSASFRLRRLV
jgi:Aspartyl protease/PDZ domain